MHQTCFTITNFKATFLQNGRLDRVFRLAIALFFENEVRSAPIFAKFNKIVIARKNNINKSFYVVHQVLQSFWISRYTRSAAKNDIYAVFMKFSTTAVFSNDTFWSSHSKEWHTRFWKNHKINSVHNREICLFWHAFPVCSHVKSFKFGLQYLRKEYRLLPKSKYHHIYLSRRYIRITFSSENTGRIDNCLIGFHFEATFYAGHS